MIGYNEKNCCNDGEKGYFIEPTLVFNNVLNFSCGWGHLVILDNKR